MHIRGLVPNGLESQVPLGVLVQLKDTGGGGIEVVVDLA